MKRPLVLLALAAASASVLTALGALVAACGSDSTSSTSDPDAAADGALDGRAQLPGDATTAAEGGGGGPTCELTRSFTLACSAGSDAGDPLNCGAAKFDAWCAKNDQIINSAAFQRAEAQCLTAKNCNASDRQDCEYRSFATATPTAAQTQVVAAYCQTCEPNDPAGCATRKTAYDPAAGPSSADDVFIAAWELSDPIADAIRVACTGSALDGGADAATDGGADASSCLKSFGSCAGGVYLDHVPDCP